MRQGGIEVTLTCRECGATGAFSPWFQLTKTGVLRLEGATDFCVDGNGALCKAHRPNPMPLPQTETWVEYDRRHAVEEALRAE